ncbi:MAG: hypothetical protein K1X64_08145 [Myxococcaceae bacterium]|nr:hypothetical protein [Myxococcaceae bacterium]
MTEDETNFRSAARNFAENRARALDGPRLLAAFLADPNRVATASLFELLAVDRANPFEDDPQFELAALVSAALDARSLEEWDRVLVELAPPPDYFDARRDETIRTEVVCHPVYGVGFLELGLGPDARVRFHDGERVFTGDDARWEHPRVTFRRQVAELLTATLETPSEDELWPIVDAIGWGTGASMNELGSALAKRFSYVDCLRYRDAVFQVAWPLRKRIEAWEDSSGNQLPCGDDRFGDLVHHIIGLGRATYVATMENPALALARAEANDYRESFTYVFQHASELHSLDEVEAALRRHAPNASLVRPRWP